MADLLLLAILTLIVYCTLSFNLVQFWITDLQVGLTGEYPIP